MKIAVGFICTLVILAAGSSFAAEVTNVGLTWQDGFTVARVDVQGAVRFTHQSEEAKDGRPFRVIVDVLSATHQLGQKNFIELPNSPVKRIRSSQYAVQPEQVVRLVFDMAQETVYKVASDATGITVSFPDENGQKFAAWSSKEWLAGQTKATPPVMAQAPEPSESKPSSVKSTAELNQSINDDRMASLGGQEQAVPSPPPSRPQAKPAPTETPKPKAGATRAKVSLPSVAKPDTITADVPKQPDLKPEPPKPMQMGDAGGTEVSSPAKPAPSASLAPTNVSAPDKLIPSTAVQVAEAADPVKKSVPEPAKATTAKPKPAKVAASQPPPAQEQPKQVKEQPAPVKETPKTDEVQPAKDPSQDKPSGRSTARFRRSPTSPTKIKGTLVAEFPTRLVIKYQSNGRRDPFATLIDETKQYNNPVEKRIPNVEGIRLVGVLQSPHGNSALFEDKDGYGYILREGDKIQKGYVLRVQPDRVFFQIFEYGWSRTVALNLESEY